MNGLTGKLYRASEFIMNMAYLNILWIGSTLLGGIVFGWAPSTVALFTVIRKWIMKDANLSIYRTYKEAFKKEFLKANGLGLIMAAVGLILTINIQYFVNQVGILFFTLKFFTFFIVIIYLATALILFPLYVQYELPFFQYLNKAVMIGFVKPIWTLILIAGFFVTSFILLTLPGVIPFFGVSLCSYILMAIAFQTFHSYEKSMKSAEHFIEHSV
ncbi:YesL family protein [Lederbergia lenta]|uniref:Putative integral inner membrane protein n=1 Tax=Lederbergia lenta TaxID=1467 RepID=A0A2X4WK05_LEDLE|nr:YesL family protein [Lederbergia lenta]MEC2324619.1 YesL family protein [Lederbergia lenta]SQI59062.1 putative integral inner membrane protein [Lederbergia lenta]